MARLVYHNENISMNLNDYSKNVMKLCLEEDEAFKEYFKNYSPHTVIKDWMDKGQKA